MKIWRGISLGLWSIWLVGLLLICTTYFLISRTILDQTAVTKQLEAAHVYDSLRTEAIIPEIADQIAKKSELNGLVNPDVIKKSLTASLSEQDVKTLSRPLLDAVYGWIDKKRPDPSFSISVAPEKEQFLVSLQDMIKRKLAGLPICAAYYVDETVVNRGECLPQYTTVDTALDEVMAEIREQTASYDTEFTDQTVGLSSKQLGNNANIPDYLGYFWALNLIALPLAGLSMLFLLIKFRGTGVIVIGSVVTLIGIGLLGSYLVVKSTPLSTEPLLHNIGQAGQSLLVGELWPLALIGTGIGLLAIGLGVVWQAHQHKQAQDEEPKTEAMIPVEELLPDPLPTENEKPKLEKRPLGRK